MEAKDSDYDLEKLVQLAQPESGEGKVNISDSVATQFWFQLVNAQTRRASERW